MQTAAGIWRHHRYLTKAHHYAWVTHLNMSNGDTSAADNGNGLEMVQINLRLSEVFLEDIDTTW